MTSVFNLPSLFFGIYLVVPLIFGCLLLVGANPRERKVTKPQRLAGILFLVDALYLGVRTYLFSMDGIDHHLFRHTFFVLDSTVISIFALIPYTVLTERYPKWWMYMIGCLPLITLPLVWQPEWVHLTAWTHLLPLAIATIELTISVHYIRESDRHLVEQFANPERHKKSWLIWITIGFILVTLASLLRYLIHGIAWYNLSVSLLWSALMVVIYVFLYYQLPVGEMDEQSGKSRTSADPNKPLGVNPLTAERILHELEKVFDEKCVKPQYYLQNDISIDTLAHACGTNRTYLAYYLRKTRNQTFYEFINCLRLEEVDRLLPEQSCTLDEIAARCGFNSSRTMRNAYKRLLGKELRR